MREILFRGKRVDNGEWIEGFFVNTADVYLPDEAIAPFIIESDSLYFGYGEFTGVNRVIPETVGQFTGMTDKNGKKIFEGDIVECFSSDYAGRPKIDTIKVKDMTDYNTMVYLNCSNELEIIGNIHDNRLEDFEDEK
jgi:uncharacterized phage protein (TIGR01671 family)